MWIDGYNYWYTEGDINDLLFTKDKKNKRTGSSGGYIAVSEYLKNNINDLLEEANN